MTAPLEPRREDIVQSALAKADFAFQELFGPPEIWSEAVWMQYRLDQHTAKRIATSWEEAA